jgi:predicted acetyltransferase
MNLRLRPYVRDDKTVVLGANDIAMAAGEYMLLGYAPEMTWDDFLAYIGEQRLGLHHSQYAVRSAQLAAEVDGDIVGRASVRFELNDFFASQGGHIGYYVLPEFRGRGYASEILRQSVILARAEGVGPVLMYCSDDNVGSIKVIERNGGVLDDVATSDDGSFMARRYWIP